LENLSTNFKRDVAMATKESIAQGGPLRRWTASIFQSSFHEDSGNGYMKSRNGYHPRETLEGILMCLIANPDIYGAMIRVLSNADSSVCDILGDSTCSEVYDIIRKPVDSHIPSGNRLRKRARTADQKLVLFSKIKVTTIYLLIVFFLPLSNFMWIVASAIYICRYAHGRNLL
jgi:hypothetical protein